jgi:hypothetical protein
VKLRKNKNKLLIEKGDCIVLKQVIGPDITREITDINKDREFTAVKTIRGRLLHEDTIVIDNQELQHLLLKEKVEIIKDIKRRIKMKTIKLETDQDLRDILGKRISYEQNDEGLVKDCIIQLDNDVIVTYSDSLKGYTPRERRYNYKYTWANGKDIMSFIQNYVTNQEVTLLDEDEYYYYAHESFKEEDKLVPFKPFAVYVSDESEEEASKEGKMTWLLGRNLRGNYITWNEHHNTIDELIEGNRNNRTNYWKYVVPVIKPNKTKGELEKEDKKADLQKQLDEAQKTISNIKKELEEI